MEGEGKLGEYYDIVSTDDLFGAKTWENAEIEMIKLSINHALKCYLPSSKLPGFLFGGDLMNQCTAAAYACLPFEVPYFGLYGACSTFAEGLILAACVLQGSADKSAAVIASSHYSTAERQYRFPLEYGCQRTPTSQRTVTGCGCALLRVQPQIRKSIYITKARVGKMVDSGVKDANHMGAAMAPAAAKTLIEYLRSSNESPDDYDLILTGDLGEIGAELFSEMCKKEGLNLNSNHIDCGTQIFTYDQDPHAGASGCGCSAIYVCGYLQKIWRVKKLNRVLLIGTGALLSPLTIQQKNSIPGIAHLVCLENE